MKFFVLTAVLAACAVSSLGGSLTGNFMEPSATTACCPCTDTNYCLDGTPCTPYCGYGKCNIFACACHGGCRSIQPESRSEHGSLESYISNLEAGETSDLFDITDANEDGKITMEEWLNSPVRSTSVGETYSMLVKHWAKFDPANVGYLTKSQVINRKA